MAESSAILKETISSVIKRSELPRYLADFATEKGYPIGRVRWSENQQRFFGYGQGYLVSGTQLPPIPGGWELAVETSPIEKRNIWMPETILRPAKTASGLPRLLDSYLLEGLLFEPTEEGEVYYDVAGQVYLVTGHPKLLDAFEQVLDGF